MWKFSIICSFMAIFTGIALNLISNSIHDKRKQLSELEKRIEQKIEKLKILETEWEFHTQPDKLIQIAEDKLGMSTKEVEQFSKIEIVKLRSSAELRNFTISILENCSTSLVDMPNLSSAICISLSG